MANITSNSIVLSNGAVSIVPSGSKSAPGTAVASHPTPQKFVVTCSANTSKQLTPDNNSGSEWYFHAPGGNTYKVFYLATGSVPIYSTFLSSSNSLEQINVPVNIENSLTATQVAERTAFVLENISPSRLKANIFTVSQSDEYVFIDQLQSGSTLPPSASLAVGFTASIVTSASGDFGVLQTVGTADFNSGSATLKLDDNNPSNFMITGSGNTKMFMSGSGKIGFNTTSPKDEIDFKVDSFKIRSADGTKETEFTGGKLINKKLKGAAGAENTGSELVMTYTPGTFESPEIAVAGDILGTVSWQDLSIGNERDATAMRIQGKVDSVGVNAIKGSMRFGIGSSVAGEPINEVVNINGAGLFVSRSLILSSEDRIDIGNNYEGDAPTTDRDRYIYFKNSTSSKFWTVGYSNTNNNFQIHQGSGFNSSPDFKIDNSGNVNAAGSLSGDKLGIGIEAPTRDIHISKNASVYLRLQSTGNQNQIIEFFNNQEPDFTIGNYFSDGGLQISSDQKTFITIGASDGDKVEISGSLEVTTGGKLVVEHRDLNYGGQSEAGQANGDVIFTGNTSTTAGTIYYLRTNGTWSPADADAEASATALLAVAIGANSTTNGMLLRGFVKLNATHGGDIGDYIYLSTAAGRGQGSAPTGTGDFVRIIGHGADATDSMYFNPSNTWVEIS